MSELTREQVEELLEFGKDMGSFDIKILAHDATLRQQLNNMTKKYQGLVAYYDKQEGTPCEQVRHQQEVGQLRQRVKELEHDNKNLLSCQCGNCDNSLEEEAVCRNCYRISRALLDNEKENVKACCTVLNEKDCYIADLTAQLVQYRARLEIGFAYDIDGKRVELPHEALGNSIDGIDCRDETIQLIEHANTELKQQLAQVMGEREAHR
jgi:hypothetical protein